MARRRRSKKSRKLSDAAVIAFAAFLFAMMLSNSHESNQQHKYTDTPQNIETMVRSLLDQDATATVQTILSYTLTATLTFTPTPTFTPTETMTPTHTSIPTRTPIPPDSAYWLPQVMEGGSSGYGSYSGEGAASDGCQSPSCGCLIKGNISHRTGKLIYHCPNGQWYDDTVIDFSKGERYFCTEQEALAAGFSKPENDPPCGGF